MNKVRQLPQVYLRGSLANITMANLTEEQKAIAEEITDRVANSPVMTNHKQKVIRKYGVTIGADYLDRNYAEQEYLIAVWRGVIHLCFHRNYTFHCEACNQSTYVTKKGKTKAIDRIQTPCPCCARVKVLVPGDTTLCIGQYVTLAEFQKSYEDMPDGWNVPKYESTISPVAGSLRYNNPDEIINDDRQLEKFFGEFVWNYFRQQINENKREEHRHGQEIVGSADYIILQELISLCIRMDVDYNFCARSNPVDGKYEIKLVGVFTPPEFTVELSLLRRRAKDYNIEMSFTKDSMFVHLNEHAIQLTTSVVRPEHVTVLGSVAPGRSDSPELSMVSQVSHRSVGLERMSQEDHVETIDNREVMERIRTQLPDGPYRSIFDILSQQGPDYQGYSSMFGDEQPKINHIANYLGITPRAVNASKKYIELLCLANDLTPANA